MSYNTFNANDERERKKKEAVLGIVNQKQRYDDSIDDFARQTAHDGAVPHYNQLRDLGYGSIADQLQNTGYEGSKAINNGVQASNLQAVRPYIKNTVKSLYGQQINDDDITFNPTNNNVSVLGYNLGASDHYDDTGYTNYYDTKRLDSFINNTLAPNLNLQMGYDDMRGRADNNLMTRSNNMYDLITQGKGDIGAEYRRVLDYLYNSNYMDSDEARAIMANYNMYGNDAANGALASGAGDNGGNIDSFAQANARRQQLAFTNAGNAAVLDAHNSKIDRLMGAVMGLENLYNNSYSQYGGQMDRDIYNSQRLYENNQTDINGRYAREQDTLNNEYARQMGISEISGQLTPYIQKTFNPYTYDPSIDYKEMLNRMQANYDNAQSEEEKASHARLMDYVKMLRNQKIDSMPEYADEPREVLGGNHWATFNNFVTNKQLNAASDDSLYSFALALADIAPGLFSPYSMRFGTTNEGILGTGE